MLSLLRCGDPALRQRRLMAALCGAAVVGAGVLFIVTRFSTPRTGDDDAGATFVFVSPAEAALRALQRRAAGRLADAAAKVAAVRAAVAAGDEAAAAAAARGAHEMLTQAALAGDEMADRAARLATLRDVAALSEQLAALGHPEKPAA